MLDDSAIPDALPTAPMAYTIAGDSDRGWTIHASALTFDEALALTHALNTIMRARKQAVRLCAARPTPLLPRRERGEA